MPKIERDKIRHRRPNDMVFEGAEPPPTRRALLTDDDRGFDDNGYASEETYDGGDVYVQEPVNEGDLAYGSDDDEDWTGGERVSPTTSGWEDESEDDWVLKGEDDRRSRAFDDRGQDELVVDEPHGREPHVDDPKFDDPKFDDPKFDDPKFDDQGYDRAYDDDQESGVVWEDDGGDRHHADRRMVDDEDEIAFGGGERKDFGFAPEVELAGRRDVRPKPPRPAPPPGAAPQRTARPQTMADPSAGLSMDRDWAAPDELDMADVPVRQARRDSARRGDDVLSAAPPMAAAAGGRFARTRGAMGETAGRRPPAPDELLHQPRQGGGAARRRQPAPKAAMPGRNRPGVARPRGRIGRMLIAAVLLVLLAGGGWYTYRSGGVQGLQPMLERVTALIPLPTGSRTAADTSFGDLLETGANTPEAAIADLEASARQQNGAPASTGVDPATIATSGPPIPEFKPRTGTTRSLSAQGSEEAQLASNQAADGEGAEPSIFEQLWRFLTPG